MTHTNTSTTLGQRLACLPQLCRLETVQIQPQITFGIRSALFSCDIGNMFPHSLVKPILDDNWDQVAIETEDRIRMDNGVIDPEYFQGSWRLGSRIKEAGFWYTYRRKVMKLFMRLYEVSAERVVRIFERLSCILHCWRGTDCSTIEKRLRCILGCKARLGSSHNFPQIHKSGILAHICLIPSPLGMLRFRVARLKFCHVQRNL
jgi:hypothetical protein